MWSHCWFATRPGSNAAGKPTTPALAAATPASMLRTCRFIFHTSIVQLRSPGNDRDSAAATGSIMSNTLSVHHRTQQPDEIGVRPLQRNCRPGRLAEEHVLLRKIGRIPYLLGNQANPRSEFLNRSDEAGNIASRRQFVSRALQGQQRPRPAPRPICRKRCHRRAGHIRHGCNVSSRDRLEYRPSARHPPPSANPPSEDRPHARTPKRTSSRNPPSTIWLAGYW